MGLVVISGGSRGLGLQCAKELKGLGHQLVLLAKDHGRLAAAAQEIGADLYKPRFHIHHRERIRSGDASG